MLHFKEHLKAIEPHDLITPSVRRKHVCASASNQVKKILEVVLLAFLDLDGLCSPWILKVAADKLFHVDDRELLLGRLRILENHLVHVHDAEAHFETGSKQERPFLAKLLQVALNDPMTVLAYQYIVELDSGGE